MRRIRNPSCGKQGFVNSKHDFRCAGLGTPHDAQLARSLFLVVLHRGPHGGRIKVPQRIELKIGGNSASKRAALGGTGLTQGIKNSRFDG